METHAGWCLHTDEEGSHGVDGRAQGQSVDPPEGWQRGPSGCCGCLCKSGGEEGGAMPSVGREGASQTGPGSGRPLQGAAADDAPKTSSEVRRERAEARKGSGLEAFSF